MSPMEARQALERNDPTPFRREPLPLPPANLCHRLITAKVLASLHNRRLIDVVMQQWPSDKLIERAVASPAMTSVAGWAQELARKLTIDTLDALGAASAA